MDAAGGGQAVGRQSSAPGLQPRVTLGAGLGSRARRAHTPAPRLRRPGIAAAVELSARTSSLRSNSASEYEIEARWRELPRFLDDAVAAQAHERFSAHKPKPAPRVTLGCKPRALYWRHTACPPPAARTTSVKFKAR